MNPLPASRVAAKYAKAKLPGRAALRFPSPLLAAAATVKHADTKGSDPAANKSARPVPWLSFLGARRSSPPGRLDQPSAGGIGEW